MNHTSMFSTLAVTLLAFIGLMRISLVFMGTLLGVEALLRKQLLTMSEQVLFMATSIGLNFIIKLGEPLKAQNKASQRPLVAYVAQTVLYHLSKVLLTLMEDLSMQWKTGNRAWL